jgi:hypothetical protein
VGLETIHHFVEVCASSHALYFISIPTSTYTHPSLPAHGLTAASLAPATADAYTPLA